MKTKIKFFLYVMCATLFFSCSNEADNIISEEVEEQVKPVELTEEAKLKLTADLLLDIVTNEDILNEVKTGVETSLMYGLDEELRFRDVLEPEENKLRSASNSLLADELRKALNGGLTKSYTEILSGDELETFMLKDNVQIYWPYSEKWDGKEMPFVTYAPDDDNVTDIMAYRKIVNSDGTSYIESRIVNEKYAMEHPVWVINKNELDYSELPNFKEGEFEKNGRLFVSKLLTDARNTKNLKALIPAVVFFLGVLTVTEQHDSWIAGGSEFEFTNAHPLSISSYTTSGNNKIRITVSRNTIDNGSSIGIWLPLNSNWTEEQIQNGLKVVETDGGNAQNWVFNLTVNLFGLNSPVPASIPYGSDDDFIYKSILTRAYITSPSSNNPYKQHGDRGVNWTMYTELSN